MQDYLDAVVDHPTGVPGEQMKQGTTLSTKVWVYWEWWGGRGGRATSVHCTKKEIDQIIVGGENSCGFI